MFASVTTVAAQAGSPSAALYQRALRWQETLGGRSASAIAAFLDPIDRGSPGALDLLARDAEAFSRADATQILEVTVDRDGRHGHTEHQVVSRRFSQTGGGVLRDRFAWAKGADGLWYVDLTGEDR